jgi:hypothetical protein
MLLQTHRRHFLLLEVLIAFALVALCALPLVYPHTAILKEQREFIRKVELDHVVNLLYANVMEKLYLNKISWSEIMQGSFDITEETLKEIDYNKPFHYAGNYSFSQKKYKPKKQGGYSHNLFTLTFHFLPKNLKNAEENKQKANKITYTYQVFIVRDLGQTGGNQPSNTQNPP